MPTPPPTPVPPPDLGAISPGSKFVNFGDTVNMSVSLRSGSGPVDEYSWSWSATCGTVSNKQNNTAAWTAGGAAGSALQFFCDVTVTATGDSGSDSATVTYTVIVPVPTPTPTPTDTPTPIPTPTVSFGASSYRIDEGSSTKVTIQLSNKLTSTVTIPITISGALPNASVTFSSGVTSMKFPVAAGQDTDCNDETVSLGFGTLPSGIGLGSPDTAEVSIDDDEECPTPTPTNTPTPIPTPTVSFGASKYSMDEGDTEKIRVQLSHSLSGVATIPITISGGLPNTSVTFTSGVTSITFPVAAGEDTDCDDETVNLGFGTLPPGVGLGTPDTAEVAIDDDEVCPTPVPAPTPTPMPALGFSATTVSVAFQKDASANRQLPAASGGKAPLKYSISPAMSNGLSFTASTRTITGKAKKAATPVLYTYTATDAGGNTASLKVTATIFDVSVTAEDRPLEDLHWGVLAYKKASVEGSLNRTKSYEFRVGIPASTGFQLGRVCAWPVQPPTSTATLWSNWVLLDDPDSTFDLVRCGLGSGGSVSISFWVRIQGEKGQAATFSKNDVTIPKSWHRDDHRVDYYIHGSTTAGIQGVSTPGAHGLFPSIRPPHLSGSPPDFASARVPSKPLLTLAHYAVAAKAWNDANFGVMVTRSSRAVRADVVIRGYWDYDPGGPRKADSGNNVIPFVDRKCSISIACTHWAGTYPHLGSPQIFWIEDPPHWGSENNAREWTTNFNHWFGAQRDYQYLPKTLMHEFGHTFGLGHSPRNDVMSGGMPICNNAFCGLTDADKRGAKAIYEHHTTHEE